MNEVDIFLAIFVSSLTLAGLALPTISVAHFLRLKVNDKDIIKIMERVMTFGIVSGLFFLFTSIGSLILLAYECFEYRIYVYLLFGIGLVLLGLIFLGLGGYSLGKKLPPIPESKPEKKKLPPPPKT